MDEDITYCASFGFDESRRNECIQLFELDRDDYALVELLQEHVIHPNLDDIVGQFYDFMLSYDEFKVYLHNSELINKLKQTQSGYLHSFGADFASENYFEERLRVGMAHKRIGMPLNLYQAAYRKLQQILVNSIPADCDSRGIKREEMTRLVIKLTALDMSLATETYYLAYVQELQASLNELRLEGDELRNLVSTDVMTGLHSREYIMGLLERGMKVTGEKDKPLSIAMLDIDWFKKVNDTYGHLAGDRVLKEVAKQMSDAVRDGDYVGRYGGEEFLIVLCGTHRDIAEKVVERLRRAIASRPISVSEEVEIRITLSAGVSGYEKDDSLETLIQRADAALYIAKNEGRNRVVVK